MAASVNLGSLIQFLWNGYKIRAQDDDAERYAQRGIRQDGGPVRVQQVHFREHDVEGGQHQGGWKHLCNEEEQHQSPPGPEPEPGQTIGSRDCKHGCDGGCAAGYDQAVLKSP